MPNYELIRGDLLDSDATYIVHQCNCMSTGQAAGIAKVIFERFPWADCYGRRVGLRPPVIGQMPGDIQVCGGRGDERFVVNLFGQFYPGGPSLQLREIDHPSCRRGWFNVGVSNIQQMFADKYYIEEPLDGVSVAFPWQIGCGIAGGDWEGYYLPRIDELAAGLEKMGVRTLIYRLPD